MNATATRQVLREAGAIIKSQGLYKGGFTVPGRDVRRSPVCVTAAMYLAAGVDPNGYPWDIVQGKLALLTEAGTAVHVVLRSRDWHQSISRWNDRDETTQADAVTLLADAEEAAS